MSINFCCFCCLFWMTIVAFAKRSTWTQLHVQGLENSCSWLHSGKIIVSSAWLYVRTQVRCSIWNSRSFCRLCVFPICRYQSHLSLITQQYSCECTLWFRQFFDLCNFSHLRIFFWTTAAIRLDHERSSFLHQSHAKSMLKRKRSWVRELRWGFSFAALPFVCPRSTVIQKKYKRQLTVWHKIKIFSLIFLLDDKCNLKSNKSWEDCVQDGVR